MNTRTQDALDQLARWAQDTNTLATELDATLTHLRTKLPAAEMILTAARQAEAPNLADINRATEHVDDLHNQFLVLISLARDVANQYAYAVARSNKRVVDQVTR